MTDSGGGVVAQLEAILAGIWKRVTHSDDCAFSPEAPCDCDRHARLQAEIARTVERMGVVMYERGYGYPGNAHEIAAAWGAAFQAARPEQEQR